jgi:hypothetical protein
MTRGGKMARHIRILGAAAVTLFVFATAWAAPPKPDPKRNGLPAAVLKALDENKPGAEIDKVTIEDEAGVKFYDMEFKGGRGEMDVAQDGTVLDVATLVEMKDLPEPVAAVIRKAATGTTVKQLSRSEVRAKVETVAGKARLSKLGAPEYVYEAELARGGEIEVAANGTIIKGPGAKEPSKEK